jgi:hypothetical protein
LCPHLFEPQLLISSKLRLRFRPALHFRHVGRIPRRGRGRRPRLRSGIVPGRSGGRGRLITADAYEAADSDHPGTACRDKSAPAPSCPGLVNKRGKVNGVPNHCICRGNAFACLAVMEATTARQDGSGGILLTPVGNHNPNRRWLAVSLAMARAQNASQFSGPSSTET